VRSLLSFCFILFAFVVFGQNYSNLKFEKYTTSAGLSSSTCTEIYQDSDGFLWFGTIDGLNKYDGYTFKTYKPSITDPFAISNNRILSITGDKTGNLWVGTWNGLNVFDRERELFYRIVLGTEKDAAYNSLNVINDVFFDEQNNKVWVATNNGVCLISLVEDYLDRIDELPIQYYVHSPYSGKSLDHNEVTTVFKDNKGNIWLGTNGKCLNKYDQATNSFNRILIDVSSDFILGHLPKIFIEDFDGDFWIGNDLSKMVVWNKSENIFEIRNIVENSIPIFDIYIDSKGVFWITTDGYGIFLYDKKLGILKHLEHDENNQFSIPNNQISSALEDKAGIYWLSTYNEGICKLVLSKSNFKHYFHKPGVVNSLSSERAQSVIQDDDGRIWIGTDGGGLNLFNQDTETFQHFLADEADENSLSSNKITYLEKSCNNYLWICTWDRGLNLFNPTTHQFKRFVNDPNNPNSIGDNSVWCAKEDKNGGLWIGTQTAGLNYFDYKKNQFIRFLTNPADTNSIKSNFVFSLHIDSKNRLFIGTSMGLNVLNLNEAYNKGIVNVDFKLLKNEKIQGYRINFINEDHEGNIWLGTDLGLHQLDGSLNYIRSYTDKDGLPNNLIVGIQEDDHGFLWITSKGGLTQFNPKTNEFVNYTSNDGIQGIEFQSKSIDITNDGKIIVGGINGVNIFDPENFIHKPDSILPVLTQLRLFNNPVGVGDTLKNRVLLPKPLADLDLIELKYDERHISFDFVALYYANPERINYAYRMKNLDNDFILSGSNRTANYSSLLPGDYEFEVKTSLYSHWDNAGQTSIKIKVLPPPWKSWWAYTLYVILAVLITWVTLKYYTKIVNEEKEHELDQLKLRFFINVAHEFRTPLTLILNPVDKILESENIDEVKDSAKTIQRSSHRLLNLVNQILDFRKVDMGKAEISLLEGDVINFSNLVFDFFKDMAEQKNIQYIFSPAVKSLTSKFDPDKLEKILTNLLSNALKYTGINGKVELVISKKTAKIRSKSYPFSRTPMQEVLEIMIIDNGIGFSSDHLKNVFSRFYKPDNTKTGTGIGLNYTKSLVDLLGGSIDVESRKSEGTTVVVKLPMLLDHRAKEVKKLLPGEYSFDQVSIQSVEYEIESTDSVEEGSVHSVSIDESSDGREKTILIVEDNKLLQSQLKQELETKYRVFQSFNGEDGLKKALRYFPDIIVSDVMMPEMDGFELCKSLKNNFDTCHIPVILLTARNLDKDKIEGFITGADDYIPKPFNMNVLKIRLENLIASRLKLREKYNAPGGVYISKEVTTNSTDEAFLDKATRVIIDNIDKSDFNLEALLKELSVSRTTFFRKITSITGHSPTQFIRTVRLKYAADLLINKKLPIKEVAYMSGFNSTSYFSKTFREHFKITPNEYIARNS